MEEEEPNTDTDTGPSEEVITRAAQLCQAELRAIYSKYCPEKTPEAVNGILARFSGREVELLAKAKARYCENPESDSDDSDDGYIDGSTSPQRFINRAVVETLANKMELVPREDGHPSVDDAAAAARSKKWDSKAATNWSTDINGAWLRAWNECCDAGEAGDQVALKKSWGVLVGATAKSDGRAELIKLLPIDCFSGANTMPKYDMNAGDVIHVDCGRGQWWCTQRGCMAERARRRLQPFVTKPAIFEMRQHLCTDAHRIELRKTADLRDHEAAGGTTLLNAARSASAIAAIPKVIKMNSIVAMSGQGKHNFQAAKDALDCQAKTIVYLCPPDADGKAGFPVSDIAAAEKAGLPRMADTARAINACLKEVQPGGKRLNQDEPNQKPEITTSKTDVKRTITDAGNVALALLVAFFLGCTYLGFCIDESTGVGRSQHPQIPARSKH